MTSTPLLPGSTTSPPQTDEPPAGPVTPIALSEAARGRTPHSGRFRLAVLLLAGLAIAAVAVAVVAATGGRGSSGSSLPWSLWKPPDGGQQGAREIADFIAPTYRVDAANQLDVITVVNLESQAAEQAAAQAEANGTSASAQSGLQVAVRPSATSSQVRLLGGNTIAYNLCGTNGRNCSIGVGKPSTNRLLLLRREALELALYTFRYVHGTDNVLAVLPPGRTQATPGKLSKTLPTSDASSTSKPVDIAVLFQRQELTPLLNHPLILSDQTPTVAQMPKAPEASLVAQVTARGLFSEELQQAQDGSSLMVLAPLPAQ
jgi:hypothetical protein